MIFDENANNFDIYIYMVSTAPMIYLNYVFYICQDVVFMENTHKSNKVDDIHEEPLTTHHEMYVH